MANNLVKFVYIPTTATPEQIAAFDANTLYFVAGTKTIYKGTTPYAGGAAEIAADLATLRTQIGTLPVDQQYTDLIDYIDKAIAAGDDAVEVIRRMRADELDFYDAHKYADLVVHNNGELSIEELARYIIQNYRTWRWKREKSRQNWCVLWEACQNLEGELSRLAILSANQQRQSVEWKW